MLPLLLLSDFDWINALGRFGINIAFIAVMITLIARHMRLRRFAFTFLMISLIVFFLCYTLKNFDLNLGMALGLFAIFGIIRYRTEPLLVRLSIQNKILGHSEWLRLVFY